MTLRERREILGVTQKALSDMLGDIDRSTIAKWESGIITPSVPMLIKLSYIYNCTIDELLNVSQ